MRRSALLALLLIWAQIGVPATASAGPVAWGPPCFGAAARDPHRWCRDQRLSHSVTPSPADAPLQPSSPCTIDEVADLVVACASGVVRSDATATVALVGDSHAAHWRAALEVVARAERWRVLSITRAGCPYSFAVPNAAPPLGALCRQWADEVSGWFARHPEVGTVFVSALAGLGTVIPPRGVPELTASIRGFEGAWRRLPASVARIVVLRDNPRASFQTLPCVAKVLAAGGRTAGACSLRRSRVLAPDPEAVAAGELRSRQTQVIDLTRFFCGRRRCFPVVGGVLVFKDVSHLTPTYAGTLGPYVLAALRPRSTPPTG